MHVRCIANRNPVEIWDHRIYAATGDERVPLTIGRTYSVIRSDGGFFAVVDDDGEE
jgi:hypothetical protein